MRLWAGSRSLSSLILLLSCMAFCDVEAQYIGLYTESDPALPASPDAPDRSVGLELGIPKTIYIVAHVGGAPTLQAGITAAEFAITGLPPLADLIAVGTTPNPMANVSLGEPFSSGANIAFPICMQPSGNGAVLLYTAQLVALNVFPQATASVGVHQFPSNPAFAFAWLMACDSIILFPAVQAQPAPFTLNAPVSVDSRSWSSVRRLYQ